MNDFLKAYGLVIIGAVVGLALVAMGLFGGDQNVLTTGLTALGTALGIHIGGNTNAVPTKTPDAVAHIKAQGGKVLMPKKKDK
jgi:hypothetical protein